MSAVPRPPLEGGLAVPATVLALLVGLAIAFLSCASFLWSDPPPEPDGARAEAVAQTGIDHACGILLRADSRDWDAILAGGTIPELGPETSLNALSGFLPTTSRMAYRVSVRDNDDDGDPAHDSDGTVWIASAGLLYPQTAGVERGLVVRVMETSLAVSRTGAARTGFVLARR